MKSSIELNLFESSAWQERLSKLGLSTPPFRIIQRFGLKASLINHDYLVDFERWPDTQWLDSIDAAQLKSCGALWAIFRKLPAETRPQELPPGSFVWPSTLSPYLDLRNPIAGDKDAMADIRRTERKLAKNVGNPELRLAREEERVAWFNGWVEFLETRKQAQGQTTVLSDPEIRTVFENWLTYGDYPPWMKLFVMEVSGRPLAYSLCYVWNGVLYFQMPAFDSDPSLRSYGLGKMLVQKLIDWSLEQKLEIFDFLQGGEKYKFCWRPKVRVLYQCEVPLSFSGKLLLQVRRLQIRSKAVSIGTSP